jgi:hypothetical protein
MNYRTQLKCDVYSGITHSTLSHSDVVCFNVWVLETIHCIVLVLDCSSFEFSGVINKLICVKNQSNDSINRKICNSKISRTFFAVLN